MTAPVAAAPLTAAEELTEVLRRTESLLRNELRWDDAVRAEVAELASWIWLLAEAADPQNAMQVEPGTWALVPAERPDAFA